MKSIKILLIIFITASSIIFSDTHNKYSNQNNYAPVTNNWMQVNNINTIFRSDGYFNYDKVTFPGGEAGFIWPVSSATRKTADFATGIWIGGLVNGQLRLAASLYNTHYSPGNIPVIGQVPPSSVCNDPRLRMYQVNLSDSTLINGGVRQKTAGGRTYTCTYDAWSLWPVDLGAPYVEVNNIPGYQPGWYGDRPGIGNGPARPDEILFCVFMDYTNCTNNIHYSELSLPGGTMPIGVEIQQLAFAFNLPGLTDMLFMKWKIINKSSNTWDSTYVSIVDDADLGYSVDDAAGCDSLRETGFVYNASNNDQMYGAAPPAIGYRLLQSPMVYTGNPLDTARLPYGIYIGYKLVRLTGYNVFVNGGGLCLGDPDNAEAAYNFMRGQDGCGNPLFNYVTGQPTKFKYSGNACSHTGWYDSNSTDRRHILSTGPVTMQSADTQIIVTSTVIARGTSNYQSVCDLLFWSDFAKRFYDSNFLIVPPIGITNISSNVPNSFSLSQNYPNPFNPTTKIRFAIPPSPRGEGLGVRVVVYDILGREVTTLVNEQLKPGIYEVEWPAPTGDASNYTSGVYFYTLQTETFSETKRMVLVK